MKTQISIIYKFLRKYLPLKSQLFFLLLIFFSILIGLLDFFSIYFLQNFNSESGVSISLNHKYVIYFMINFTALFLFKLIHLIINRLVLVTSEEGLCNEIIKKNFLNRYIDTSDNSDSSIVNLITYESKRLTNSVIKPINLMFSSSLMLSLIVTGLIIFGYSLTLIIGALGTFLLFIIYMSIKKKFDFFNKNLTNKNNERTKNILDILKGSMAIKSYKLENFFFSDFKISNYQIKKLSLLSELYQQVPVKLVELFIIILIFLFYLLNYFYSSTDNLKIDFFVYFYAFYRSYPLVKDIYGAFSNFQNNKESYVQIKKYLDEKFDDSSDKNLNLKSFNKISFKNISIQRKRKKIINNLSVDIKKSKFMGISGKSGSGKTTLALALSGLINISSGSIYLNNTKIDHKIFYKLRKEIIYLSENPFIVSGTLEKNMFGMSISNKKLKDYLKLVNFEQIKKHDYINTDNDNISYGQKQKIALIRSLLFKPKILILDEALNGIDLKSMSKILNFLKKQNITVLLITHNISVMKKYCDDILKIN